MPRRPLPRRRHLRAARRHLQLSLRRGSRGAALRGDYLQYLQLYYLQYLHYLQVEADTGNSTAAAFHGQSRVELDLGALLGGVSADLKLQVRAFTRTCVLLHAPGVRRHVSGPAADHVTLALEEARLRLSFSMSGSSLDLVSEQTLSLGTWHTLHFQRWVAVSWRLF